MGASDKDSWFIKKGRPEGGIDGVWNSMVIIDGFRLD